MNIIVRNASDRPIYEQIKDQIKEQILSGSLKPDQLLPSIRLLAKELRISVITTKRAYDELEQEGFIHSVQGKGSFVANQNESLIKEEHLRKIEKHLQAALHYASVSGVSLEELADILHLLKEVNQDE